MPAFSTAEMCTNTSLEPSSGWIKPKPFWVLKNFTVPTGIIGPFTLPVERPRAHRVGGNYPSFGSSLGAQPKPGACQQDEAENQVAGGGIDGFRCKVNGQAQRRGDWRHPITLYELVIGGRYSRWHVRISINGL